MSEYRVMVMRIRASSMRAYWKELKAGTRYACEKYVQALEAGGSSERYYITRRTAEGFRKYHGKINW